jgi:hypothetical protein
MYMSQITTTICSVCRNRNLALSPFITHHLVCEKSNTMGATCGAGTAYPYLSSPSVISRVRVARSLIFCEMFCRSLFVLFVLFLSAIVVSFIYVRFMITSLISSNLFGIIGLKSSLSNAIFIYWFHPLCFNEIQVDKREHWPSNMDDC